MPPTIPTKFRLTPETADRIAHKTRDAAQYAAQHECGFWFALLAEHDLNSDEINTIQRWRQHRREQQIEPSERDLSASEMLERCADYFLGWPDNDPDNDGA